MNNDLDLTPFPTFDEFSVGQMLPQCGSTQGMSSDDESIEDLIDKDNHMFIQEDSKKNILDSFKEKELSKSDIFYLKKEHKKLQDLKGRENVIGYYDGKNLIAFYIIEDRNNYTYLKTIWVDEEYRQKGIASKIMKKIKEENSNIETNVEDDNEVGKKLADKHGFRRRGKDKYGNIMVYRGNKKTGSINEKYMTEASASDVDKIVNTFTKEELKEYAPHGGGKHENVVYRDVKKINGIPVAFIEVDQCPDDKKKNDCNIAVGCSPEYRGNGYVKELLNKFIKSEGHKYNKIWYGYKKTNTNSKKLIESIGGFKNVGGREGMEWNTLEIKESALSTKERNRLDDSFFGLPTQRKYPMPDKKHVLLAIKFFNQCPPKHKKELSININNRINELFSEEEKKKINIGNTNTFLKYYNTNESALININEGYFSELEIQIQDSGCDILEDYVFNNKPTQQGFVNDGIWNSLIMYNGKRYRERVEALILDDHNHIFLAFKDKDRLKYKIPGGSSEKNQTLMQQLQDECNEEAKIYIKDIKYIFTYTKPYNNKQYTDAPYYGYFAHIFVAKYNGKYLKPVKEKDLDLTILNNGRFYDIADVFDKLTPVHKAALLQSNQLK